jgi:predicted DNA-binding transcriptional regulator AlpA
MGGQEVPTAEASPPGRADPPPAAKRNPTRRRLGIVITKLTEFPEDTLLDEAALAQALGIHKRTIRRMVRRYELPPPVSFAGRATWQAVKVLKWFETRAERLAREAERDARRLGRLP